MIENFTISNSKKIKEINFKIKKITNRISETDKNDFIKLINFFNSEYSWPEMFTIDDVFNRIKEGHIVFLLYYKNISIGYSWYKEINKDICFGYNLYVTKKEKRPGWGGYWFYKQITDYMLVDYETINIEVNDWNITMKDIIKSIGYYK